ncbi:MAG: N-acetyltransferase family protein [Candidatus Dormibacteria bacterium]
MSEPVIEREPLESVLRDGTHVGFRPIRPGDKRWLRQGMREMSPESRYRRFFSAVEELSEDQLRYFTEVDQESHVAWVATLPDEGGKAVGVSRFVCLPADPEGAEAAVTVIDTYQHRGIGRALLLVITREAIARGVKRFVMFVLGENEGMLSLLHEVGAVHDGMHDGVHEFHVPLPERVEDIDQTAAPRVLRVAAEGNLRGEVSPEPPRTRFLVGKGR